MHQINEAFNFSQNKNCTGTTDGILQGLQTVFYLQSSIPDKSQISHKKRVFQKSLRLGIKSQAPKLNG